MPPTLPDGARDEKRLWRPVTAGFRRIGKSDRVCAQREVPPTGKAMILATVPWPPLRPLVLFVIILAGLIAGPQSALADEGLSALKALADKAGPGRWIRLPGSPLDVALGRDEALKLSGGDKAAADRLWGWGGPPRALGLPSAMAFDGRRLYVFGGGKVYRGNDILAYDLETLRWQRLYDPSPVGSATHGGARDFLPLRGPMAVDAYSAFVHSPLDDALYLFGANGRHPWRFRLGRFGETGDPWTAWEALDWPEGWKERIAMAERRFDGSIVLAASGRNAFMTTFSPVLEGWSPLRDAPGGPPGSLRERPATGRLYTVDGKGRILLLPDDADGASRVVGTVPAAFQGNPAASGMAFHAGRDLLLFWPGGRVVWSWDPDRDIWEQFNNFEGDAPAPSSDRIYSAFRYVPKADLFLAYAGAEDGLFAWRMPDTPEPDDRRALLAAEGYGCSDDVHGWACPDLAQQIATGSVMKGVYVQCARIDRPVDFNGALIKNSVCGGKAALIARDGAEIANVTIENISIGVNGACIRWEGGTVRLRHVHCLDSDMGLLGTGDQLVIEDSLFERTKDGGRNYGHVLYLSRADRVEIRNSILREPGNEGHVLKSGARILIVEDSELAGGSRPYSRLIDAFNGGELLIKNTILKTGPHGGNGDLIGYGAEMRTRFSINRVSLEGGVLDCLAHRARNAVHAWSGKARPDALLWRPAQSLGCPDPRD